MYPRPYFTVNVPGAWQARIIASSRLPGPRDSDSPKAAHVGMTDWTVTEELGCQFANGGPGPELLSARTSPRLMSAGPVHRSRPAAAPVDSQTLSVSGYR